MSRTPTAMCDTAWMVMTRTLLRRVLELGVVPEEPFREVVRTAQRRQVPAVHLVGHDPEPLPHDAALELRREEAVVATQQEPRRDVGPRGERPRRRERCGRLLLARAAPIRRRWRPARRAGTCSTGSSDASRPARLARGRCSPTIRRRDSPGRGTIAATRTIRSTGTRSHTSGAVNPASDCATTTTSRRSPIASTTQSAYSPSPAESSATGRSTATTSCPAATRSGATRCQYHASDPAPGSSTKVAISR